MMIDRRRFLRSVAATSLVGAGAHAIPRTWTAHAAETGGYRALVCVFLFGGLDGHDLLLPYDLPSWESFSTIRQTLLNGYEGGARSRESLLPLAPDNASLFGSRQFALPPEMPLLRNLFDEGRAAIVGNVGPLIEPVTAAAFANGSARVPSRLFSHNDQQSTWQASAPEGALLGWGGLFADAALASGANASGAAFTNLSMAGVGPFLTGNVASPYQVSVSGSASINVLQTAGGELGAFLGEVEDRFRAEGFTGSNILARDIAAKVREGIDSNSAFDAARRQAIPLLTPFPETPLGGQLKAVAETISIRDALFASRQIFFVGIGGFDTHSDQGIDLPGLLAQIDGALAAFDTAMIELGVVDSVTTFTASDFGRTLTVNGDGTDHGWGGHHILMGGSVRGRHIFGDIPPAELDHPFDAGAGRLIPSLAVEQFAAPLGRWWGLDDDEIAAALPNLGNFDPSGLDLFVG